MNKFKLDTLFGEEIIFENELYNKICVGLFGFRKGREFKVTRSYKSTDRVEILKLISNNNKEILLTLFDNIILKERDEVGRYWCGGYNMNCIDPKIDYTKCNRCTLCCKLTSLYLNSNEKIEIFSDSHLLGYADWTYIIDISDKENISLCISSGKYYNDFIKIPIIKITNDKIKSLFNIDANGLLSANMSLMKMSRHFNEKYIDSIALF